MIYALCDPRPDRQEVYIGKTKDSKIRLKSHISDGSGFFRSIKKINANPSGKANWINSMLISNVYPKLIIIDKDEKNSEANWIKSFAEYNFILTNSRIDINNCLNGYGLKNEGAVSVPIETFKDVLKNINERGIYLDLKEKIHINTYDYYPHKQEPYSSLIYFSKYSKNKSPKG